MKTSLALSIFGLSLVTTTAALPGINIIQNGDFESMVGYGAAFPPWQFDPGFSAEINSRHAASGGNLVYLPGFMWQDLATEVGQAYRISYFERGDVPGGEQRVSVLYVYWGNQLIQSHLEFSGVSAWHARDFEIVATSTTSRLMFAQASWTAGGVGWPSVDAVSVITIVPEPSALAFAGAGLCVV